MFTAYVVVGSFLAVVLVASTVGKFQRWAQVEANLTAAGVRVEQFRALGLIELAGAIGLIVGIWVEPIGVAAAIGVVVYFLGAVGAHLKMRHYALVPPASLLVIAVLVLVFRIASL